VGPYPTAQIARLIQPATDDQGIVGNPFCHWDDLIDPAGLL
jgi:hypothetical protein